MYRVAIRNAKKSIVIVNAYFFPGWRFVRDLHSAAERGVEVLAGQSRSTGQRRRGVDTV